MKQKAESEEPKASCIAYNEQPLRMRFLPAYRQAGISIGITNRQQATNNE